MAAVFFAFWDKACTQQFDLTAILKVILAAFIFCVVSSGIYILNDIKDIEADRTHPVKRLRPVAAGLIPIPTAWFMATILIFSGMASSLFLSRQFAQVIASYVAIQFIYSYGLKQVALLDVLVLASGFVLRAIAGAVALPGVTISPWLLLCTFLLALFLGLCKRRQEKIVFNDAHRQSLLNYDQHLLDLLVSITAAAVIVSYSIYTLWPGTVEKFGTHSLGFTIPFVIFGVFRYMELVYRHEKGDRPELVLLTDIPILVNMFLYTFVIIAIFFLNL